MVFNFFSTLGLFYINKMPNKKIALITGVSREMGLGFETAKQLAQKKYRVIITARDYYKVKELADRLLAEGLDVLPFALDILSDDSVENLVSKIETNFGKLHVLVNNAGGFYDAGANALDTSLAFAHEVFETNLFGAWRMIKSFTPLLEKSGEGVVVNITSGAGTYSDPDFGLISKSDTPLYGITKLALNGLTVKLAPILKTKGILINAVNPGFAATYPGYAEWGARPVAQGAKGIVWAAILPKDGPTGSFFMDGKNIGWQL